MNTNMIIETKFSFPAIYTVEGCQKSLVENCSFSFQRYADLLAKMATALHQIIVFANWDTLVVTARMDLDHTQSWVLDVKAKIKKRNFNCSRCTLDINNTH